MKPTIKMLESPLTHTTTFRGDLVTHHMLIYLTFPSWKLNNIAIAIVSSNQHRQLNFGDPITPNLWVDLLLERVLKWNIEKLAVKCIHRREKRSRARRPKRWTQRPWRGSKDIVHNVPQQQVSDADTTMWGPPSQSEVWGEQARPPQDRQVAEGQVLRV